MMLKTLPVLVVLLLGVRTSQGQCPDIAKKLFDLGQTFKTFQRLHTSLLSTAKELQLATEQISSALGLDRNNDHGDDFSFAPPGPNQPIGSTAAQTTTVGLHGAITSATTANVPGEKDSETMVEIPVGNNYDGSGDDEDIPVDSHDGGSGEGPSLPQIMWRRIP